MKLAFIIDESPYVFKPWHVYEILCEEKIHVDVPERFFCAFNAPGGVAEFYDKSKFKKGDTTDGCTRLWFPKFQCKISIKQFFESNGYQLIKSSSEIK
jgi:hypothetical protein